jgi:anti-sigma B factor antagonist
MHNARFPVEVIRDVPVVVAPEEIDITNADVLRTALLEAAAHGRGRFVVDMTRTRFCDTAGLHALVSARKRAQAEGGDVLLVMIGAATLRIFAITGLDRVFRSFSSLEEAIAQTLAVADGPPGPGASPGTGALPGSPPDGAEGS